MTNLTNQTCQNLRGPQHRLAREQVQVLLSELDGWELDWEGQQLSKTFLWKSFPEAIAFVNAIAELAEAQNHHPDIDVRYRKVTLRLNTHDVGGISINDPILACHANRVANEVQNT